MPPAILQLIAVAGPQVVSVLIDLFKSINSRTPEAISPTQWAELRALFSESYEARKARIEQELKNSGALS